MAGFCKRMKSGIRRLTTGSLMTNCWPIGDVELIMRRGINKVPKVMKRDQSQMDGQRKCLHHSVEEAGRTIDVLPQARRDYAGA